MFLQTSTRRLLKHGTVTPCSSMWPPLWLTVSGKWIAFRPAVELATAPETRMDVRTTVPPITHRDFATTGGFYSVDQMEESLEAAEFADFQRSVTARVSATACSYGTGLGGGNCPAQGLHISQLTDAEAVNTLLTSGWTTVEVWIDRVGESCAIAVVFYLAVGALVGLIRYFRNLFVMAGRHGLKWEVVKAATPTGLAEFVYERAWRRRQWDQQGQGKAPQDLAVVIDDGEGDQAGDVGVLQPE